MQGFALNAANARWGSLYDALYGTDMIDESDDAEKTGAYNPIRGDKVIAFAKQFLDQYFQLQDGSFTDVVSFSIENKALNLHLDNATITVLDDESKFVGFTGSANSPQSVLLTNNNLHVEILIDKSHSVGATDKAGIKDILLESKNKELIFKILDFLWLKYQLFLKFMHLSLIVIKLIVAQVDLMDL